MALNGLRSNRYLAPVLANRRGSIAVQTVMLLGVMLGFAALGLEVTMLFAQERRMQAAADAAVMAATRPGYTAARSNIAAVALAGSQGFLNGQNNVTVTYNSPPTVGSYGAGAGEVVITKTFQARLLSLFTKRSINLTARAIATQQSLSAGCLLALNTSSANAIVVRNGSSISNTSCELAANSSNSTSALYVENKSNILGPIYLVGGMFRQNNTVVTGTPQLLNVGIPVTDPYAAVQLPSATGTCKSGTVSGTQSLTAGYFCTGISVANGANLTLGPGVYFIDGAFTIGRNATITGTGGVTLLFNSAPSITIGNGATVSLTAPLSGTTAGMAITSQRAITNTTFAINNNATIIIEGAVYLPGWTISISGQVNSAGANCTQLIADKLDLASNLSIKADCGAAAVKPIGRSQPVLVQ